MISLTIYVLDPTKMSLFGPWRFLQKNRLPPASIDFLINGRQVLNKKLKTDFRRFSNLLQITLNFYYSLKINWRYEFWLDWIFDIREISNRWSESSRWILKNQVIRASAKLYLKQGFEFVDIKMKHL